MVRLISSADFTSLSVSMSILRDGEERRFSFLPRLDQERLERERERERERLRDLDQSEDERERLVDTNFLLSLSKGFCCTLTPPLDVCCAGDLDRDVLRFLSSLDRTRDVERDLDSEREWERERLRERDLERFE